MIYFVYAAICLVLIVAQTSLLPWLSMSSAYDLLIPFVVYLGLQRTVRESLPFVIFMGLTADSLSGSPFGLYLTVYFWFYIAVRAVTRLVQALDRPLIAATLVAASVLAENIIFMGALALGAPQRQLGTQSFGRIAIQAALAFVTGPLLILVFKNIRIWALQPTRAYKSKQA